jgi:hypothetical protein
MRRDGIKIISIGKKKYPGAHAFECYALEGTEPRYEMKFDPARNVMVQVPLPNLKPQV